LTSLAVAPVSQLTQWGSVARVVRNYDVIAPRIDDIIAERARNPQWDPFRELLSPPLTKAQLTALRNLYDIPMELAAELAVRTDVV
jgi:hypothetical protein